MAILTLPNDRLVLGPLDVSLLEHLQEYYNADVAHSEHLTINQEDDQLATGPSAPEFEE